MKFGFFPRLAWTGIRKNRRLYLPYLFSCIGMVMMVYILFAVSLSPLLSEMRGGTSTRFVLSLGKFVLMAFALIFLFYTSSFLVRRRYKEFGLYSVLGMDRRGITRVVLWESLTVAGISLAAGLVLGIAFSKLAELGLLNAIHAEIDYTFTIRWQAVLYTVLPFLGIFFLLFLRTLWRVKRAKPLDLMSSEKTGERVPKANWVPAVLGVLILAAAYGMAVTIESPLTAFTLFFVAVIMVIVATYLLFISGSVALCRGLQKNKRYYYKKNHFVSVSSMAYRMKRNGAGLASICILCTMVLVMISSTSSLYYGSENAIISRYPEENEMTVHLHEHRYMTEENLAGVRAEMEKSFAEHGVTPARVLDHGYATITGALRDGELDVRVDLNSVVTDFEKVWTAVFLTPTDYQKITNEFVTVAPGEVIVASLGKEYPASVLTVAGKTWTVSGRRTVEKNIGVIGNEVTTTAIFVVADYAELAPVESGTDGLLEYGYYYGYDLPDADEDTALQIYNSLSDRFCASPMGEQLITEGEGVSVYTGSARWEKEDFFGTFGGLFFLGILLSAVFIFAAVTIIYYKQISEGYEDQARFAIMRQVGMTEKDIRQSINSQMLTVFFIPLLMAGLHLAFSFPMVWKLLKLFYLTDVWYVILVTVGAFLLFGALYALIYKITARAYYKIVTGSGRE